MLSLCNTSRGRTACALGGVLIAVLALACLWAFSPTVAAGDGPAKVGPTPGIGCPDPVPPPLPKAVKKEVPSLPPVAGDEPPPAPDPKRVDESALPKPDPTPPLPPVAEKKDAPARLALPPVPAKDAPDPLPPVPEKKDAPPPVTPVAGSAPATTPPPVADVAPLPPSPPVTPPSVSEKVAPPPTPPAPPASDNQDIKQLVVHLSEIRADRAKLDEKERQTIQTIKKKYQDQKRALEQLERELRQLGINCDEGTSAPTPARPTATDGPPPLAN
jgi:hypothetical protein